MVVVCCSATSLLISLLWITAAVLFALSFSVLYKSGTITVGANTSVLLYKEGSEEGTETIRLSPSETFSNGRSQITVIVQPCSEVRTTKVTLPIRTRYIEATSNDTVIPFNYNHANKFPFYTVDNGYINYSINGKIQALRNQPSCIAKAIFFSDFAGFSKYIHKSLSRSEDFLNETCLYTRDEESSTVTRRIPLNSTGFYFVALEVPQFVSLSINQTLALNTYYMTSNIKKDDCILTDLKMTCTIGISEFKGTKCTFVQSTDYFHLQYRVTFTDLVIGLIALSFGLLLMTTVLLVVIGGICCFLISRNEGPNNGQVNPEARPAVPVQDGGANPHLRSFQRTLSVSKQNSQQ